ncbi:hypothetical protein RclHR1_05040004 [Rhizophagus clarus]|uniref:Uncharacterized protein n=1 Tax=Rhizophagus clarus TaxID=94130 RepID=A0A2Z6RQU0_9GLOM|nr:hypothetical protein RclHR1_05040004 [Rhizophagus clarus]
MCDGRKRQQMAYLNGHLFSATKIATCDYQTTCVCPASNPQGTYCGGGLGCDNTHVYECNPAGGECTTCDYGLRFSCAQCGNLDCPAEPPPSPPANATNPPTAPPPTPPPSPPPTVCGNPVMQNYIQDACVFLGNDAVVQAMSGVSVDDIVTACVASAAPFALETLGGTEAICALVAFLATEAVAAGATDPACNNICNS